MLNYQNSTAQSTENQPRGETTVELLDKVNSTPHRTTTDYPDCGHPTEYEQDNFDEDDDISNNAILSLLG